MENITLEKIWAKLGELDEKIEDLAEYIEKQNLETRSEIVYTHDDVDFIKHNILLIRQYQVNAKNEIEKVENDLLKSKQEFDEIAGNSAQ
jgi:hypothetical protein